MLRLRKRDAETIPREEKKQLANVKRRLDRVERRMGAIETEVRLIRREQ